MEAPRLKLDDLKSEIKQLRKELGTLNDKVATLNDFVVSSFEELFKMMEERKVEESSGNEHYQDDKMHTMNTPSFVPIDYFRDDMKGVDDSTVVNAQGVTIEQVFAEVSPQK